MYFTQEKKMERKIAEVFMALEHRITLLKPMYFGYFGQ